MSRIFISKFYEMNDLSITTTKLNNNLGIWKRIEHLNIILNDSLNISLRIQTYAQQKFVFIKRKDEHNEQTAIISQLIFKNQSVFCKKFVIFTFEFPASNVFASFEKDAYVFNGFSNEVKFDEKNFINYRLYL